MQNCPSFDGKLLEILPEFPGQFGEQQFEMTITLS